MSDALVLLKKSEAANARSRTRGGRLAEQALAAAVREDDLSLGLRAIRLACKIRRNRDDISGSISLRERGVRWVLEAQPTAVSTTLDQGDLTAARRFLDRAIPLAREVDERRGAAVRVPVVEEQEARLTALEAG